MRLDTFLVKILLCMGSFALYADWNQDFEERTRYLIERMPELQKETYIHSYEDFLQIRNPLLQDQSIRKKMAYTSLENKLTLLTSSDRVVIKKRRNNHIHELFAWEVSCLLGVSDYMLPSFPLEIEGKRAILQAKEQFSYGKGKMELPSLSLLRTVSLEGYWRAHFCAYLLGIADLVSKNIGIGEDGKILFFDAEVSFSYQNKPFRTKEGFSTGFIMASFEWPQYSRPLDAKMCKSLQDFVARLSNIEDTLRLYEELREFSFLGEGLADRLDKVRSFALEEGKTFEDFFCFVYPKLGPGLDKLSRRVSRILQKKVGHGASLMFMTRDIHRHKLSPENKASLEKWLDTYIE
ncbi:MAG: hypothetical protein V4489_10010 [Chlamydiota bacterium]